MLRSMSGTGSPNRLAELREAHGLSRLQVAAHLGKKTERTVYRWEVGETDIPDDDKLALADLFQVSVTWLMRWPDRGGNGNGDPVKVAA